MAITHDRTAPLMDWKKKKKKKQKQQDGPDDGKEEEAEVKGDISEGREEEVGMLNPCISPDSYHAGVILATLKRERIVPTMRNPIAVAPKIWCVQHLLRILVEGGGGSSPA